jgi:hypothetical protein
MEATYIDAVEAVMQIYLDRASEHPGHTHEKITHVTALFIYLLSAEVKPLLLRPDFAEFRHVLLDRIHAFTHDAYARSFPRFGIIMAALFSHLVQDDKPRDTTYELFPCHCSTCAVTATALSAAHAHADHCLQALNSNLASTSTSTSNLKIKIKVKVLPRRSARLMSKL